jgi:hypothetical protein
MIEGWIVIARSVSDRALFVIASLPQGGVAISVFQSRWRTGKTSFVSEQKLDIRVPFIKITIKKKGVHN